MTDEELEKIEESARHMGETLTRVTPSNIHFALILFDANEHWLTYSSNAEPKQVLHALHELEEKLKKDLKVTGNGLNKG